MKPKDLSLKADEIIAARPKELILRGKKYKLRRLSGKVRGKIDRLNKEVYVLDMKSKNEMTLRQAKRISRKMYSLHSKTAACYILGRWAAIKLLYSAYWRWLNVTKDAEQICRINECGMRDTDLDFSLANWQITNAQLALSMRLIGNGIEEYQKRMESATRQASKDGTPTKVESKSGTSSTTAERTSESSTSTGTTTSGLGSDTGT